MTTSIATAVVVAVNLSEGGIPKHPVPAAEITPGGLVGDGHDHAKHETPVQAVSIFDLEDLEDLECEGFEVGPGSTGENLTVRGLEVDALGPGDRLHFSGGLALELTKKRKPCYVLDAIHPDFQRAVVGRCGFYARVITPARVAPGETIRVATADSPPGPDDAG